MKKKLLLGTGLGLGFAVLLALAIVGVTSMIGDDKKPAPATQPAPAVTPVSAAGTQPAPPAKQTAARVVINDRALTTEDLENFQKLYRTKPAPGNFWYDSASGLYGAVGQSAAGFMYPGHNLGPLAADASKGNTGVFINGREQTAREVAVLTYLARTQVLPGRYWLDGRGNAGYEGNPIPVGNLFAAAIAAQQGGGGGNRGNDSDNFWNTRFSAGNYNSDNSAGYVSLPGGGTVSYGY